MTDGPFQYNMSAAKNYITPKRAPDAVNSAATLINTATEVGGKLAARKQALDKKKEIQEEEGALSALELEALDAVSFSEAEGASPDYLRNLSDEDRGVVLDVEDRVKAAKAKYEQRGSLSDIRMDLDMIERRYISAYPRLAPEIRARLQDITTKSMWSTRLDASIAAQEKEEEIQNKYKNNVISEAFSEAGVGAYVLDENGDIDPEATFVNSLEVLRQNKVIEAASDPNKFMQAFDKQLYSAYSNTLSNTLSSLKKMNPEQKAQALAQLKSDSIVSKQQTLASLDAKMAKAGVPLDEQAKIRQIYERRFDDIVAVTDENFETTGQQIKALEQAAQLSVYEAVPTLLRTKAALGDAGTEIVASVIGNKVIQKDQQKLIDVLTKGPQDQGVRVGGTQADAAKAAMYFPSNAEESVVEGQLEASKGLSGDGAAQRAKIAANITNQLKRQANSMDSGRQRLFAANTAVLARSLSGSSSVTDHEKTAEIFDDQWRRAMARLESNPEQEGEFLSAAREVYQSAGKTLVQVSNVKGVASAIREGRIAFNRTHGRFELPSHTRVIDGRLVSSGPTARVGKSSVPFVWGGDRSGMGEEDRNRVNILNNALENIATTYRADNTIAHLTPEQAKEAAIETLLPMSVKYLGVSKLLDTDKEAMPKPSVPSLYYNIDTGEWETD